MAETLFGNDLTDKIDAIVAELHKVDDWPVDEQRDRQYVGALLEQFPALDLAEEIRSWRVWLIAKGTGKEVRSRGRFQRFRNWCRSPHAGPRAASARARRAQRRTGTHARSVEEWGDTRVGW